MYIYIYIRERYYFSLVCRFEKATKNIGVKVHVQKGALLGLKRKLTIGLLVFIQFTLSSIVIWS